MDLSSDEESSPEKPGTLPPSSGRPEADATTKNAKALDEMMPQVYEELRLLAAGYLRNERPEHTLQRTALVHEAYLRLAAQKNAAWENPEHLLAIFARLMRQTLTNHAVARSIAPAIPAWMRLSAWSAR